MQRSRKQFVCQWVSRIKVFYFVYNIQHLMDYNNTRKSQPSPGLWSLIATGRVSDGGVVMLMCGCRRRERAATGHIASQLCRNHSLRRASASVLVVPQYSEVSYSCATIAIFISVVPQYTQYQAPVPGPRGQHNDTSMISLFLLTICTCIPEPSNSRGWRRMGINNCLDIPVSVDTNMSTSLPTIYPSYLYLNSQENKVNTRRYIMRNVFYSHDISIFMMWRDFVLSSYN